MISRYLLHHDEEYFDDPFEYIPERFLLNKKPKKNKYSFIPFGGGHHACPGQWYANMAIKLIFSLLVKYYTVEVEGERPPYKIFGNEVRSENSKIRFIRK